jgi:hypothetical protein
MRRLNRRALTLRMSTGKQEEGKQEEDIVRPVSVLLR